MGEISFRKLQGIYQISFENRTLMAERPSRNFQSYSSYRKFQTNFAFPNTFYRKQSLGVQRQDKTRKTRLNNRLTTTQSYRRQYRSNILSFIGSNDSCKDSELKISLNFLYVPTCTEIFCSFTFTDNSFRVQSTTLKTDTSQWWIQGRGPGETAPHYFQTKLRPKGPKKLFAESGLLPYLRVWMTVPTLLSEGLDPPLHLHTNSIKNYVYCPQLPLC